MLLALDDYKLYIVLYGINVSELHCSGKDHQSVISIYMFLHW